MSATNAGLAVGSIVLVLAGGIMGGKGLADLQDQHGQISRAQRVTAHVTQARVDSRMTSGKHPHRVYWPVIAFTYEVGGNPYLSDRLMPLPRSGGRDWADAVRSAYHSGQTITAWYDPALHSRAFLIPEYQSDPYFVAGMGVDLLFGGFLMGWIAWTRRRAIPRPVASGMTELPPLWPLEAQQVQMFVVGVLALAGTAAVWGHFFLVARVSVSAGDLGFASLHAGLPVALIIRGWWLTATRAEFYDARVTVDTWPVVLGKTLTITVSQVVKQDLTVQRVAVRVFCTVGSGKRSRVAWSEEQFDLVDLMAVDGQTLRTTLTFGMPFPAPEGASPRWSLEVRTAVEKRPDYKSAFPLEIIRAEP